MLSVGVLLGLMTALFHSLAYLATRWFTQDRGHPAGQLLVLAHVVMGLGCGVVLPFLWPQGLGWQASWLVFYGVLIGFFVVAQCCLIEALRYADASRVAPLLGLKIALLALVSAAMGQTLVGGQWLAVGLAVSSAWALHGVGGRLPLRATVLVVMACTCYAVADTCIFQMMHEVQEIATDLSLAGAAVWTVLVVYSGLGLIALPLLVRWGTRAWGPWRDVLPYVGAWMAAMVCLYAAFAILGTVFGAILQSTRGLMSIGLGVILAHTGWHHLEQKHGAAVIWRRLAAAGLMTAAVALYVWCRS